MVSRYLNDVTFSGLTRHAHPSSTEARQLGKTKTYFQLSHVRHDMTNYQNHQQQNFQQTENFKHPKFRDISKPPPLPNPIPQQIPLPPSLQSISLTRQKTEKSPRLITQNHSPSNKAPNTSHQTKKLQLNLSRKENMPVARIYSPPP